MIETYFIYSCILSFGTCFAFCVENTKQKDVEIIFRFLLFLVLLLPSIFRDGIAADYNAYKRIYDFDLYWDYAEIGFSVLCTILKHLGCDAFWMFFWCAFITYFFICFFIKKYNFCIFIFFYIAFYGYFNTFDQIRQALTVPFVLFSFYAFSKRKHILTLFYITIACLFHRSSLIFLVLLPLSQIFRGKQKLLFFTFICSILLYVINYNELLSHLTRITNIRYLKLLENSLNISYSFGVGVLLKILFPLFFILTMNNIVYRNSKSGISFRAENISAFLGSVYICLSFLTLKIDIFNRIRDVVWVGLLFAVTMIPQSKYKKFILFFLLVSGVLLYYVVIKNSVLPGTKMLAPYSSIFD